MENGIDSLKALIAKKAIDYCIKEEGRLAGPWIGGTCLDPKVGQGKRNDLDDFAKAVFDAGVSPMKSKKNTTGTLCVLARWPKKQQQQARSARQRPKEGILEEAVPIGTRRVA